MPRLTTPKHIQTEQRVLKFYRDFRKQKYCSPTIQLVAKGCGLAWRSSVYKVLARLVAKKQMIHVAETHTYIPA